MSYLSSIIFGVLILLSITLFVINCKKIFFSKEEIKSHKEFLKKSLKKNFF